MEIKLATLEDMEGVFALLRRYHVNSISPEDKPDGFVTTNLTEEQMAALITEEKGVTVAKNGDKIVAFALAASWNFWKEWPLFAYMIQELPNYQLDGVTLTAENSYQYGPVCVDMAYRGTGLFEKVFAFSLHSMAERFPIMATFVNQINPRSYAAHSRKALLDTTGTFQFNNNNYYLMTCRTK